MYILYKKKKKYFKLQLNKYKYIIIFFYGEQLRNWIEWIFCTPHSWQHYMYFGSHTYIASRNIQIECDRFIPFPIIKHCLIIERVKNILKKKKNFMITR